MLMYYKIVAIILQKLIAMLILQIVSVFSLVSCHMHFHKKHSIIFTSAWTATCLGCACSVPSQIVDGSLMHYEVWKGAIKIDLKARSNGSNIIQHCWMQHVRSVWTPCWMMMVDLGQVCFVTFSLPISVQPCWTNNIWRC